MLIVVGYMFSFSDLIFAFSSSIEDFGFSSKDFLPVRPCAAEAPLFLVSDRRYPPLPAPDLVRRHKSAHDRVAYQGWPQRPKRSV
jgi:hypothetical protein